MTVEELQAEKRSIMDEMESLNETSASIKDQLAAAKTIQVQTGQYADPDWWRRANFALRATGRSLQGLQNRLGDVNRELRALTAKEHNANLERRFIATARQMLPSELYEKIWSAARLEHELDCSTSKGRPEAA